MTAVRSEPLHVAVVGKGLIGSAAARHLAAAGVQVTLVGPDEPADFRSHPGVFAAHYDAARITRILDRDPIWADLAAASIARYPEIAAASGLQFHFPVGFLAAGGEGSDLIEALDATAAARELPIRDGAGEAHPYQLPAGTRTRFESGPAGWIDPRRLVQAEVIMAIAAGAKVTRLPAWALRPAPQGTRVILDDGSEVIADRVLVCAGAFSGPVGLAPGMPLAANGRVVLLARVEDAERDRWQNMPSLIRVDPTADLGDVYLLPPVRYPDGCWYVKIGTGAIDHPLDDLEALQEWYRYPALADDVRRLGDALTTLLPELADADLRSDVCAITETPSGHPLIDWVEPGRIAIACGGNGKAAKSADEIGRLAALEVSGRTPDASLMAPFRA